MNKSYVIATLLTALLTTDVYTEQAFQNTTNRPVKMGACGSAATPISIIQGEHSESPHVNKFAVVEAVVTAVAPELSGYFVQEESSHSDNNSLTSEGIFIYSGKQTITVKPNQLVRVTGKIAEYQGKTQLSTRELALFCKQMSVKPVKISPPNSKVGYEAFEGMLVEFTQPMTVLSTYNLHRYGELELSDRLLFNPTQIYKPGSKEAMALAKSNRFNRITLDDFNKAGPDSINLHGQLSSEKSIRAGALVTNIYGVVDEGFNAYRLRTLKTPEVDSAPRPVAPEVKGDLVIAAFNVLNLFNGNGKGDGFPTDRGAETEGEYIQQQQKILNAILTLKPDVIGLNEIENDSSDNEQSAIAQLTLALNAAIGSDVYDNLAYDPSLSGAQIANGMLYRKDKLTLNSPTKALTSDNSAVDEIGPLFNTLKSRPALTQAFTDINSGKAFVVSVNHLKSKGSKCGDNDDSREQGNCNGTRKRAALGLSQWLAQEYSELPVYVIGDLNSYAQEDPIRTLNNAGYTDVIRKLHGPETYTYSYRGQVGSLDYVMANTQGESLIQTAFEWHINAVEPRILDYRAKLPNSDEIKPDSLISNNPFRSSDHDPVVFSIRFN